MLFSQGVTSLFLTILLSLSLVDAHPGELEPILTRRELELRQLALNKRHAIARNCDSAIADYEAKRRAKRSAIIQRRREGVAHGSPHGMQGPPPKTFEAASHKYSSSSSSKYTSTSTASTASPSSFANTTYTAFQNTTCVLTPEGEEGPYYIHEPLIRTDIRDGMDGVPLTLDIGLMDITTCTPIEDAMVDVWHCNATGIYSGFIASESSNTGNSTSSIGTGENSTMSMPASMSLPASMSGSASIPVGSAGPGNLSSTGGFSGSVATDQETFGRGAYPTDSEGLVEFNTIFPGFYSGRAIHIHTVVLLNYTTNANGTVGLEAGHIQHVGQIFFEESWSKLVMATSPYNQETIERTTNNEDRVYIAENIGGYNATAQLSWLGDDLSDGLLGYVTIGIDPTASYTLSSVSYYTGDDSD